MPDLASLLNRSIAEREALELLASTGRRRTITRVAHLRLAAAKLVRWTASTLERAAGASHGRTAAARPTPAAPVAGSATTARAPRTHAPSPAAVRPGSTHAISELLDVLAMMLSNETLDADDTRIAWHLSRLVDQTLDCRDEIIREAQRQP
jgi:hypothetical protein